MWKESIDHIRSHYRISVSQQPDLENFHIITGKDNLKFFHAWEVKTENVCFNLCLVQYDTTYVSASAYKGSRYQRSHTYFFGFLHLEQDYGIAYIRPESLADKISELVDKTELDFETHYWFSFKYYVLANDKEHFKKVLTPAFLSFAENIHGLEIEFNHHACIFRLPGVAEKEEALNLCHIGLGLDKVLNAK